MPDDVFGLHELLCALKHSHVMFPQHDLHGIGAERGGGMLQKEIHYFVVTEDVTAARHRGDTAQCLLR